MTDEINAIFPMDPMKRTRCIRDWALQLLSGAVSKVAFVHFECAPSPCLRIIYSLAGFSIRDRVTITLQGVVVGWNEHDSMIDGEVADIRSENDGLLIDIDGKVFVVRFTDASVVTAQAYEEGGVDKEGSGR